MKLSSKELALVDFQYFTEKKLGLKLWECQRSWLDKTQAVIDSDQYKGGQFLAPADHGKTSRVVVPLILWLLCRDRNSRILLIRNTDPFAQQIGRAVKQRIEKMKVLSEEFGLIRGGKWSDEELTIERPNWEDSSPSLLCLGAGADVQSQRADFLIVDDLATRKNSRTESQRAAIKTYFFTDLASRLDKTLTKKKTLVYGTRVDPSDIYSENMDRADWVYVEDRAIVDDVAQTILAPEGHTYDELSDLRSRDTAGFELMYQQRSASLGIFVTSSAIEGSWKKEMPFYQSMTPDLRGQFVYTWMSLDPAFSTNRWSSNAVLEVWGMKTNGKRQLIWAYRQKTSPENLLTLCEMKFRLFMPDHFMIEGNQGQILLIPVMKRIFPGHSSKFKPVFTTSKDGSLNEDIGRIFDGYNKVDPDYEIPYKGVTEQAFAHQMKEEYTAYPNGAKRDTLMAQYIGEKGLGLIKEEVRRGYVHGRGIVGVISDRYQSAFQNPYWRKAGNNGW